MDEREHWTGKTGFVLASVGAAIGLGNVWMFPWRLGAYGGAAYLVIFLFFVFAIAVVGLMGEFAFGRSHQRGALGAISKVFKDKNLPGWIGSILGVLPVLAGTGVFIFYTIVVGWVIRYFLQSIVGFAGLDVPAFFGQLAGQPISILWHFIAMVLAVFIVMLGIQRGIEKINRFMLPLLFILFIILTIRSVTLPGAMEGIRFMLIPDWSFLARGDTWVMALGQAFFTVSLGGCGMLVYGSYLSKGENIPSSAINVAVFDVIAALLAAFMIMPAVFAFGLDPAAGPPLLFITLPSIFPMMPVAGHIFGVILFGAMICAVFSSIVNLVEIPVEAVIDRFKLSRKASVIIVGAVGFLVGLPLALDMNRFGLFADTVSIYLIPLGAVIAAVVFFWIFGASKAREEINQGATKPVGKWLEFYAKYVFVIVSVVVLVLGIIYGGI